MAFHGDLSSYPLPELLNWLDASRKSGALHVSGEGTERKLYVDLGVVVAVSAPSLWERLARALEVGRVADGAQVVRALRAGLRQSPDLPLPATVVDDLRSIAADETVGVLADLTQSQRGRFHWSEDSDRSADEWVPVDLPLRHAMFESLRWLDEQAEVDRVLGSDALVVAADFLVPVRPAMQAVVQAAAGAGTPLGRLRLALGLQRTLVARAVYDLLRTGAVRVDGAPSMEPDPVADMLEKGATLLRERQFDAAMILFQSLVQSDPSDRRVREFARMVEREHMAALYAELPPLTVLTPGEDLASAARLRSEERQLLELVNGRWDVSALVLSSQLRELEALKTLKKLVRLGLVRPVSRPGAEALPPPGG